jgi:hypothetical protein
MMRKGSDIKDDIEKIKKLKALQIKATNELNKITENAAVKLSRKKKTKPALKRKPAGKNKAKTAVKKGSFWKRIFGKKTRTVKRNKSKKARNKR